MLRAFAFLFFFLIFVVLKFIFKASKKVVEVGVEAFDAINDTNFSKYIKGVSPFSSVYAIFLIISYERFGKSYTEKVFLKEYKNLLEQILPQSLDKILDELRYIEDKLKIIYKKYKDYCSQEDEEFIFEDEFDYYDDYDDEVEEECIPYCSYCFFEYIQSYHGIFFNKIMDSLKDIPERELVSYVKEKIIFYLTLSHINKCNFNFVKAILLRAFGMNEKEVIQLILKYKPDFDKDNIPEKEICEEEEYANDYEDEYEEYYEDDYEEYYEDFEYDFEEDDYEKSKDPYEILGVSKDATKEEIKKRYKELVKKFHPDFIQGKGLDEEFLKFAEEKMKEINWAYEELMRRVDK